MYSPEFHYTRLRVERKVGDVNVTGALVNGRRLPNNPAVALQNGLVHNGHYVITIGANGSLEGIVERR